MRARVLSLFVLAALASGCSLIVSDGIDPLTVDLNTRRDVSVRLVEFTPHIGQPVIVEIVNPETNFSVAHARIDPLPSSCAELTFPLGASVQATRVDFYADILGDGLMPPDADHVWREDLDESGRLVFAHEFDFVDIAATRPMPQGGNLIVDITGFDAMAGASVVLALVQQVNLAGPEDPPDRRPSVNAIYTTTVAADGRVGVLRGPGMDELPALRGVVDGGVPYTIELNIDGTMRCQLERQAPPTGDFMLTAAFADFGCDTEPAIQVFEDCGR